MSRRALHSPRWVARLSGWWLSACAVGLFGAPPVDAQIKVKTLDDGSRLVFNENQVQRARRTAGRLLPVPEQELADLIDHHARRQGLHPQLVQAVMQVESGYNPRALSNKGAMGLMQLMPDTAKLLQVSDAWDPEQNIRGGTAYLRQQMDRFGDLRLALAAYNAGPSAVAKYDGIPPYTETQSYVTKVLGLFQFTPPADLQDHARSEARRREKAAEAARPQPSGQKVYLTRDANNRLVLTTTPPKPR